MTSRVSSAVFCLCISLLGFTAPVEPTEPPAECVLEIEPTAREFTAAGGPGFVKVFAPEGCPWTAASSEPFITLGKNARCHGNGVVEYTVAANPGSEPRDGLVRISNETSEVNHHIFQDGQSECVLKIEPLAKEFAATGGRGHVRVFAPEGCAWTAASSELYITLDPESHGSGYGVVEYTVAENPGSGPRSGKVTISNGTSEEVHWIFQDGWTECFLEIEPEAREFPAEGGRGFVKVFAPKHCPWAAASSEPFITLDHKSRCYGDGVVEYTVAANPDSEPRDGVVTIADETSELDHQVFQDGQGECTVEIEPHVQEFAAIGGSGTIAVFAPAHCEWTAATEAPFITIDAGSSGLGDGQVEYSVTENLRGLPRGGILTIAEETLTVLQEGCASIEPAGASFGVEGGTGVVQVSAPEGCKWKAESNVRFAVITAGSAGSGDGSVRYKVAENRGPERRGTLSVAGHPFVIEQDEFMAPEPSCITGLEPESRTFPAQGGFGKVVVSAPDDCHWKAATDANFIEITSRCAGVGAGVVEYRVRPNQNIARRGSISFGDLETTILQEGNESAVCVPDEKTLCLAQHRFALQVSWRDFRGGTGEGKAVPLTSNTGYFWYFDPANVELVLKVLDGRPHNGAWWVFYGSLSNVEFTMVVTDTKTGITKSYDNPAGGFGNGADIRAFPDGELGKGAIRAADRSFTLPGAGTLTVARELFQGMETAGSPLAKKAGPCTAAPTHLCLNGGRFKVEVAWKDFRGHTGDGQVVPLTPDTGCFWFFDGSNVELVIKVLDGRPVNGRWWVFYGALSNVEYTITVTDTLTGVVKTYFNPLGKLASVGDVGAFAGN